MRIQGLGFRVQGSVFRVQGSGFRVKGLGLRIDGPGFMVGGLSRVHGLGFTMVRARWGINVWNRW